MTPWLTYLTTGLSHCILMATTLNAFYKLVSSKAQSSGLTFDAKNVYSGHLIKNVRKQLFHYYTSYHSYTSFFVYQNTNSIPTEMTALL